MSGSVGPLPVRVPIVVGVTGHCNIDPAARAQVEASVEKILKHLNMLSSGVLQVMTGLADGADLLVADIADRLGIPIVAVLPSPAKAYRLEISETNRDRFDSHWEKAALQIVLPNPVLDDSTSSKDAIFQLCWRLFAVIAATAEVGEVLEVALERQAGDLVLSLQLPKAQAAWDDTALFHAAASPAAEAPQAGMFGTGFTLRLARAEARSAGGRLERQNDRLIVHLPGLTLPPVAPSLNPPVPVVSATNPVS